MITGMGMSDPKPTFAALFTRIRDTHPDLAYLHVIEPRDRDAQSTSRTISCAKSGSRGHTYLLGVR